MVGKLEILVPMAEFINKDAELARLDREIEKLNKEVQRVSGKLNNPKFVDKAPAEVVAKEKGRLQETNDAIARLQSQQARIAAL